MAHYVEDKQMKKMRVYNDSFTAGRYSLPRFGRESENEPHIVIQLFIWFMHVKHISKYVEVKNDTLGLVLRSVQIN